MMRDLVELLAFGLAALPFALVLLWVIAGPVGRAEIRWEFQRWRLWREDLRAEGRER